MAIPLLIAMTIPLVWLLSLGLTQVLLVDASREAARALARGDSVQEALAAGQRVAPAGSRFTVHQDDEWVEVVVVAPLTGPGGLWGLVPTRQLRARSVAHNELDPAGGGAGAITR